MKGIRSVFIVAGLAAAYSSYCVLAQVTSHPFDDNPSKLQKATGLANARGACPGTGDCCAAHGGVGCDDFDCCDLVCFVDGYCCEVEWDADCASLAVSFCGSLCQTEVGCGQGDCCSQGTGCSDEACCELVCNADLSCCLSGWSLPCAQLAGELCQSCQPIVECPQPGACCEAHPASAGCERSTCCYMVCELDPTCCTDAWSFSCARTARENCLNVCDCDAFGNFDSHPLVDLSDAAAMLRCFSGAQAALIPSSCACADYDGDGDSDLDDFAAFVGVWNGPQ